MTFTGRGRDTDGKINEMEFTFGDGGRQLIDIKNAQVGKEADATVTHTYKKTGSFTATLRVKDNSGSENRWSSTPVACSITVTSGGDVGGTAIITTAAQLAPPAELPKAGVSQLFTLAYMVSGIGGIGLKTFSKILRDL